MLNGRVSKQVIQQNKPCPFFLPQLSVWASCLTSYFLNFQELEFEITFSFPVFRNLSFPELDVQKDMRYQQAINSINKGLGLFCHLIYLKVSKSSGSVVLVTARDCTKAPVQQCLQL